MRQTNGKTIFSEKGRQCVGQTWQSLSFLLSYRSGGSRKGESKFETTMALSFCHGDECKKLRWSRCNSSRTSINHGEIHQDWQCPKISGSKNHKLNFMCGELNPINLKFVTQMTLVPTIENCCVYSKRRVDMIDATFASILEEFLRLAL
jgi:hypothetical protein